MFRWIREQVQHWMQNGSNAPPQVMVMEEKAAKEILLLHKAKKKIVHDSEEDKDMRMKSTTKLQDVQLEVALASAREQWEQERQRMKQDMEESHSKHLLKIAELQFSWTLCEEQKKTAELERECLMRDRERMEKHVAQLEATLASEREQNNEEKEKLKHLQSIQASLEICEEQQRTGEVGNESTRALEQMKKAVRLVETLVSAQERWEKEKEKMKLDMEERSAAHLHNIAELQASLKLCEEREKRAKLERESLMRDKEQLEKHVAQLEATLAAE